METCVLASSYSVGRRSAGIILPKVRDMLLSVALVNHLYPYSLYDPSSVLTAKVYVLETSDPPFFSVIHCPLVHILTLDVRRVNASLSSGSVLFRKVKAAPSVIARGHPYSPEDG